jgi:hypothetical protein
MRLFFQTEKRPPPRNILEITTMTYQSAACPLQSFVQRKFPEWVSEIQNPSFSYAFKTFTNTYKSPT